MPQFRSVALTLALVLSCHGLVTRQENLQSCLSGLQVAFPNDTTYPQLSQAFNSRLHFSPAAVVKVYAISHFPFQVLTPYLEPRSKMSKRPSNVVQTRKLLWSLGQAATHMPHMALEGRMGPS